MKSNKDIIRKGNKGQIKDNFKKKSVFIMQRTKYKSKTSVVI